jgi:hypothetical protein
MKKNNDKISKIYYKAIFVGIGIIILICFVSSFTIRDRNIRLHGTVVKAPIVEFYGRLSRPNGSVTVNINGENLNAGSFDYTGYKIGDYIEVCYIPGEYCVVQTRMNPKRYYLFFSLEAFVLLIGIYLIVGGLKGQNSK